MTPTQRLLFEHLKSKGFGAPAANDLSRILMSLLERVGNPTHPDKKDIADIMSALDTLYHSDFVK